MRVVRWKGRLLGIESKTTDLRMLFIPSTEIAGKRTHGALEDLVYLKWFNGELEVEGFKRRPLVPLSLIHI